MSKASVSDVVSMVWVSDVVFNVMHNKLPSMVWVFVYKWLIPLNVMLYLSYIWALCSCAVGMFTMLCMKFVVQLFIVECFHSEMILIYYAGPLSGFLGFFDEC